MPHWRQKQKRPRQRREPEQVISEREARRTAALAQCIRELDRGESPLSHSLIAERVGVPVQYVRWRYPSVEHLLAMAKA